MRFVMKKSTVALWVLLFVWGASWPVNKLAVDHSPPLLYAGIRALLGGLLLTMFLFRRRDKIQWRLHWRKYVISAMLNTVLFFGFQTAGLVFLPGGLFSVLVYFQPVLLGLFAWIWLGEYLAPIRVVGLVLGFVGMAIVTLDGLAVHVSVAGVILGLLAAASWAFGVIYVKKVSGEVDPMWMVAMQCTLGGVFLLGTGSVWESWSHIDWHPHYLFGLAFGATVGLPLAFVIYYQLVNAGEASKVGSYTFLVPIIAVVLSVMFLDEALTITLLLGLLFVGVGIYFVNMDARRWLRPSED